MASTNETSVLKLPQFVGSDKPSWLGDFNGAMLKIDTAVGENQGQIAAVETVANAAKSKADAVEGSVTALGSEVARVASEQDAQASEIESLQNDVAGVAKSGQIKLGTVYKIITVQTQGSDANSVVIRGGTIGYMGVYGSKARFGNTALNLVNLSINNANISTRNKWLGRGSATITIVGGIKGNPLNLTATPASAPLSSVYIYRLNNAAGFGWGIAYFSDIDCTVICTTNTGDVGSITDNVTCLFSADSETRWGITSVINTKDTFESGLTADDVQVMYDQGGN